MPDTRPDVSKAAATGTQRELLVAMRDRIAVTVQDDSTPARDLAALTRRLMEIAKEIEAIDTRERESGESDVGDEPFDAAAL
jgi:hypothetical protein